LLAGPVNEVMKQGVGARTGGLQTSALALGLSEAAIKFIEEQAQPRAEPPCLSLAVSCDMKTQHWLTRQYFGGVIEGIGWGILLSIIIMNRMSASPENSNLVSNRGLVTTWGTISFFACFTVGEFIARGAYKRRSNKKPGA
jgi:hypothetical protein